MFLKRLLANRSKNYAKLQQSSKSVMREFYEEFVYFMHQPNSVYFRLTICACVTYVLCAMMLNYQRYYARVYKRKMMRLFEMRNDNMVTMSDEEHDVLQEYARGNMMR